MLKFFVLLFSLSLAGRASAIMENFVGLPLSEIVASYGTPTTSYDVDVGKRAFMWTRNTQFVSLGYSNTTGNVNLYSNTAFINQSTTYSPPVVSNQQCNYTVIAEKFRTDIEGPAAWKVISFKKPSLLCE